jgi:hypothetical protein
MNDTDERPQIRCPRCGQSEPSVLPAYRSREHMESLARRLSHNLRHRRLYGEVRPVTERER